MKHLLKFYLIVFISLLLLACNNAVEKITRPEPTPPDVTGPKVSTTPAANALNVSPNTVIRMVFDEPMDPRTLTADNVTVSKIYPDGRLPVPVEAAPGAQGLVYIKNDRTLIFTPATFLEAGAQYKVDLFADVGNKTGIKDEKNNVLVANNGTYYSWIFTVSTVVLPDALKRYTPRDDMVVEDSKTAIEVVLDSTLAGSADLSSSELQNVIKVKMNDNFDVPGTVSYNVTQSLLQFIPEAGYVLDTKIQVVVAIKNKNTPASYFLNHSWNFFMRKAAVRSATSLKTIAGITDANTFFSDPSLNIPALLTVDNSNNAMVMAVKGTRTGGVYSNSVAATRYTPSAHWPELIPLNPEKPAPIFDFHHVMDPFGNITVLWQQDGDVLINRFDIKNSTWMAMPISLKTIANITATNVNIVNPSLIVDNAGNVMVIAVKNVNAGSFYSLVAVRYTSNTSWLALTDPSTEKLSAISNIRHVMDSLGNITVLWQQEGDVWINRFATNNSTWMTTPTSFKTIGKITTIAALSVNFNLFGLFADNAGNITAMTTRQVSFRGVTGNSIVAARYTPDSGWPGLTQLNIDNPTGAIPFDSISVYAHAMDSLGNITVLWKQGVDLLINRFDVNNSTWMTTPASLKTITKLTTDVLATPSNLIVDKGNVTVITTKKSDNAGVFSYNLVAARYTPNTGWLELMAPNVEKTTEITDIRHTIDSLGNISILWEQEGDWWFNHFDVKNNAWMNASTSLKTLARITSTTVNFKAPGLIVDNAGNVTILAQKWVNNIGINSYAVIAARYTPNANWVELMTLGAEKLAGISDFRHVVDLHGNITALWLQNGDLWINRID